MLSKDRDALIALYNATGGASWMRNTNWNTDSDLSLWHGVGVNDQGRVVELSLRSNNLRGMCGGYPRLRVSAHEHAGQFALDYSHSGTLHKPLQLGVTLTHFTFRKG